MGSWWAVRADWPRVRPGVVDDLRRRLARVDGDYLDIEVYQDGLRGRWRNPAMKDIPVFLGVLREAFGGIDVFCFPLKCRGTLFPEPGEPRCMCGEVALYGCALVPEPWEGGPEQPGMVPIPLALGEGWQPVRVTAPRTAAGIRERRRRHVAYRLWRQARG